MNSKINRTEIDLFMPSGTDTNNICRDCKYCFSTLFTPHLSHCDICGVVDGLDYACENCFETGNNNGTFYAKEEIAKFIKKGVTNG